MQSCSDFLEQEPGSQTSITEQLKNKEGVLQAMRGLYVTVEGALRPAPYSVYADLQGGNLKFTPTISTSITSNGQITINSNVAGFYSFDDQADNSNLAGFYGSCYAIINQTNLLLEFTDALPDATAAVLALVLPSCRSVAPATFPPCRSSPPAGSGHRGSGNCVQ